MDQTNAMMTSVLDPEI